MWGMATLAMEVSRTSMKVARVTVRATAQGLCFGFQLASGSWGIDRWLEAGVWNEDAGKQGEVARAGDGSGGAKALSEPEVTAQSCRL